MNEHLSYLPAQEQEQFFNQLRIRWCSAFFELILVRILQELGASVDIEKATQDGKRPDFWARFPDGSVVVEATAPVINGSIGDQAQNRIPLMKFLESIAPPGWWMGVSQLPDIGPQDSQREFKRAVREMLRVDPPENDEDRKELVRELPSGGIVRLRLIAARGKAGAVGWEPTLVSIDNTGPRIRHAVRAKRRQVRDVEAPVLLAILASGMGSDFEDFDRTLFGGTHEEHDFTADGIFMGGEGDPTYAAVLAFLTVGFSFCSAPVLYRHPRFAGGLPSPLLQIEQRMYNAKANNIETIPAQSSGLIDRLNLVKV